MNKQKTFIAYFCFLVLSIVACSKDADPITPELVVSTEMISLSNQGESKAFHIKSNVNWTLSSTAGWVTFSATSGTTGTTKIELSTVKNPTLADREGLITVVAGSLTKQIQVVQSAANLFSVAVNTFTLGMQEQELSFIVESNGPYSIQMDAEWIRRKADPVASGTTYTETLLVQRNGNIFSREAKVILKKGNESLQIDITQEENPLKIADISSGMGSNAVALASKLHVGWNLGNALEAAASSTSANETMWGNPKTTKTLIDAVKAAGFNAVRIPCAWSGYIEDQTTYRIKDVWLERVKEVVDYCVDNNMYAIINIHWDGGWLEEHPLYSHQQEVNKKQKALWEQIAVYFRDYDEHLLFAGTNEVHANYNTPTAEHIAVQQSYNQTFVNAVRSTGGRNAYRNLIVQSYNTNIRFAIDYMEMPTDIISNRLMAETHFYDPYDFCLDNNSNKYLWGAEFAGSPNVSDWGQEEWADLQFADMKTHFVDRGIPVILGEYAVAFRTGLTNETALQNHKKARNNYLRYVTGSAKMRGLIPFYWDNGHTGDNGSGLFNRNTAQVVHQDAVDAIILGAK